MTNLITAFWRWLKRGKQGDANGAAGRGVVQIMRQLEMTHEQELSCDDVLRLMDECAEAALRGEDITAALPLFQRHLDMCADCRDEYEALLRILRAQAA